MDPWSVLDCRNPLLLPLPASCVVHCVSLSFYPFALGLPSLSCLHSFGQWQPHKLAATFKMRNSESMATGKSSRRNRAEPRGSLLVARSLASLYFFRHARPTGLVNLMISCSEWGGNLASLNHIWPVTHQTDSTNRNFRSGKKRVENELGISLLYGSGELRYKYNAKRETGSLFVPHVRTAPPALKLP